MGKSDAALNYKSMSPEDRRSFDRWLRANAIFGLILAAGVVAMAFAGSRTVGSRDATMADNRDASVLRLLHAAGKPGCRRPTSPHPTELIVETMP